MLFKCLEEFIKKNEANLEDILNSEESLNE